MKGKTRKQILELFGSEYTSDLGGYYWTYKINRTWFRRERALVIEFDDDGFVINVENVNAES